MREIHNEISTNERGIQCKSGLDIKDIEVVCAMELR